MNLVEAARKRMYVAKLEAAINLLFSASKIRSKHKAIDDLLKKEGIYGKPTIVRVRRWGVRKWYPGAVTYRLPAVTREEAAKDLIADIGYLLTPYTEASKLFAEAWRLIDEGRPAEAANRLQNIVAMILLDRLC